MYLIMNERKYAEHILDTGDFGTETSVSLFILAKYYAQVQGMKKKAIITELDKIMRAVYPGYVRDNWESILNKAANQAAKYKLVEVESIPVTECEMAVIGGLKTRELQKLAFTLLVIAKFYNTVRTGNNNWVNCDPKDVFSHANISAGRREQAELYSYLTECGFIAYSNKTGSVNARVLIVDTDTKVVLNVPDLRSLGHEYLLAIGQSYNRCEKCGLLFRVNKNSGGKTRKYCKNCENNKTTNGLKFCRFVCIDCGKETFVASKSTKHKCRCPDCQTTYRRNIKKLYNDAWYLRHKAENSDTIDSTL